MDLLNILFPKKCINCKKFGNYLCDNCFTLLDFDAPLICAVCSRSAIGGLTHPICRGRYTINGVFASLVYKGMCKKLIYQFKFQPYLTDLRHLMGELFYEGLIQQEQFVTISKENAVLAPIPLSRERERGRGYNQANLLAEELARKFVVPVGDILHRQRNTLSQVGKTQMERRKNIKGAFSLQSKWQEKLGDKVVLLVDDVMTSGATMNEAAYILKRGGAKEVWGLAFAHGV